MAIKLMRTSFFACVLLFMFLVGCSNNDEQKIASQIAELPLIELSSVDTFESYAQFVNRVNALIDILNHESGFEIPPLDPAREAWEKAAGFITKYGPLIQNYNDVIEHAKIVQNAPSDSTLESLYQAEVKFAFELVVIGTAAFYSPAYKGVGFVYRASGLTKLASKCGTCVKTILSEAHWTVRSVMVDGSSQVLQLIFDVTEWYENSKLKAKTGQVIQSIKNGTNSWI